MDRNELIAEIQRRSQAVGGILPFTQFTFPSYEVGWHHKMISHALDRVARRQCKRLMIFAPPRHGKTELVSRRFPAYLLGTRPDDRVLSCSYNSDLAMSASRDVQRIITTEEYGKIFPQTHQALTSRMKGHIQTMGEFELPFRRGGYKVAGVGGGITGRGFNIGIIDDPIKSRKEAESPTYRNSVWEWYQSDFYTRRDRSDAAIVLIQTRWHHDDLAGRLLEQMAKGGDQWEVLILPAVLEERVAGTQDPREFGEALWPERFDLNTLKDIKEVLGSYNWSALYQQRPVPREGGMFKIKKLMENIIDQVPMKDIARSIRYWDKAGTPGGGCLSAGVLMHAMKDRTIIIADCVAGQWGALEREQRIKSTAQMDGRKVKVWCEQEPGSGGKESAEATVRNLAGFVAKIDRVTGSKEVRAEPFSAQVEGGNVYILNRSWTKDYLEELELFPSGKMRDRVDASSGAFNKLFFLKIAPHAGSVPSPSEAANMMTEEQRYKDLLDAAGSDAEREELLRIIKEFANEHPAPQT